MSVRQKQNKVEELRAQIEACAVVARQQAQSIDGPVQPPKKETPKKAHEYPREEYLKWLDRCEDFYNWLLKNRIPKNGQCDAWFKTNRKTEYLDCAGDGWRMVKPVTQEMYYAYYSLSEFERNKNWYNFTSYQPNEKLGRLQQIPGAARIFCIQCDTCAFKPDIAKQLIRTYFFDLHEEQLEDGATLNNMDAHILQLNNPSFEDLEKAAYEYPDLYHYSYELIVNLEYLFLDPDAGQGFVFCNFINSLEKARTCHVQWNGAPYIYVELICAHASSKGMGGRLLKEVEKLAVALGAQMIVLSSLAHVIYYYLGQGYVFADVNFNLINIKGSGFEKQDGEPRLLPISKITRTDFLREYNRKEKKRKREPDEEKAIPNVRLRLAELDPPPIVNDEELTAQHTLDQQLELQ